MDIIKTLSLYILPVIVLFIIGIGYIKGVKVYEVFVEGAEEGIKTVFRIIPSLVGLMTAIGVFRASGALDILVRLINPVAQIFYIPKEVLPLAFLRPISGSASLALVSDIIKNYGVDTFVGRCAATMMGSTETIFYTLAVYFGAVGIKNIRYTLLVALMAEAVGIIAAVWACALIFG